MESKKLILIIASISLCIVAIAGFEIYSSNQPDNTLEFLAPISHGGSLNMKGKDIKIVEDIFLNEIEYVEGSLFDEFPQSGSEYTVLCYLKNSQPKPEDFLLNFNIQKNPRENEYVIMGNILGGQDRHGYIRGEAYYQLSSIIEKYQNK